MPVISRFSGIFGRSGAPEFWGCGGGAFGDSFFSAIAFYFFSIFSIVATRPGSRPSLITLFEGNVGFSGTEACGVVAGAGLGACSVGIPNLTWSAT